MRKIFALTLLATSMILTSVTLVYAAPAITLSPYSGAVGTKVIVYGTGFSPNSTVLIFWDEWGEPLNMSNTDGAGAFIAEFIVPEAVNGHHTVLARDLEGNTASATFTVVASITLTPDQGIVGSTFGVVGKGFGSRVWVWIFWDGDFMRIRRTSEEGTFTWDDDVPEAYYGAHTVMAIDEDSNTASAIFFVESNIEVDPSTGYVGTIVTVFCTGYGANKQIWIVWDPSLPTQEVVASGVTNDVGTFEGDFEVPDAVNGNHFVSGIDSDGNIATTIFTVNAHLFVVPSAGYVGDSVIAYGTGFSQTKIVSIKWDATPLTTIPVTIQTNSTGAFLAVFYVPQAAHGLHTVEATDENGTNASTSYNVASRIVLDPDTGLVNSSSTAVCTGFAANKDIDILWDPGLPTQQILSSGSTNNTGTYIATITIPSATNGTHIVKAIDADGNIATTIYWAGPRIVLNPDSGYVGTQTTIIGTSFGANKTVTIKWDGNIIGTTNTSVTGAFSYALTIPSDVNGIHQVTAVDSVSNTAYAYYIVLANIIVSENSGYVGDVITVVGTGFDGNSIVSVYWDGTNTQRSEISNSTGNVSLLFIIPESVQGIHEIQYIDSDGNPSNILQFTVNPKIDLSKELGYVGDTITVAGTGFAANSPVTLTWDGTSQYAVETSNARGSVSVTYTIPPSPVGLHKISAYDDMLNMPSERNFTIIPPEIPILISPADGTFTNVSKPTFSWSAAEGAITYSLQYSQDEAFSTGVTTIYGISDTTYTLTTPLTDGVWYWRVQAYDAYPNPSGYSDALSIVVDTTTPTSSALPLSQYQNSTTFNIAYTSSDNLSGVAFVELYYSYNGGTFMKYGQYTAQNGTVLFNVPYGDGQYDFYTVAVDKAGNVQQVSAAQTQTIVDTTKPTSFVNVLPQYTTQRTFNVTFTGSDTGSGVSYVVLFYSTENGNTWNRYGQFTESPITFTAQFDGKYMFFTVAIDNAGNVQNVDGAQAETIVDTGLPESSQAVYGMLGNGGWYISSVTVLLSGSDTTTGMNATYYSIDGNPWQKYRGLFSITTDGIHTVNYYSVDNAGNSEPANSLTIKIDKTAPHTTSDVKDEWYSESLVLINLIASDNQSGVSTTYYRLDGGVWTIGTAVTITDEGVHTLEFYSIDVAGNIETTETAYVKIDSTSPIVLPQQIIENGKHIAGTYKFVLAIEDKAGISNVTVYIDGGVVQEIFVNPQTGFYEFLLDTTILPDEEHNIIFSIIDHGNHTTTIERVFIVDNTPPVISSFTPEPYAVQTGQVSIYALINEASGVSSVYISIDGSEWRVMAYDPNENRAYYEWSTNARDNGLHGISIKVVDSLGNTQVSDYTIRVDNPNYAPLVFSAILIAGIALIYISIRESRKSELKTLKTGEVER